ncbi:MAG: AMP-binding protein, partial [Gemmatimonadales bacterium]
MTQLNDLKSAIDLPDTELATRFQDGLAEAARLNPDEGQSLDLDVEVVETIRRHERRDAILEHIELESLAGLLDRHVERLTNAGEPGDDLRGSAWAALDLIRFPTVLRRINADGVTELWAQRILAAVEASHFTVGPLYRQRAEAYADRVLFELPQPNGGKSLTWRQAAARVQALARGLLSLHHPDEPARIAILSENRLEVALLDHACLTSGLVNIMVPANATDSDVGYILKHAKVRTIIVSGREQLEKVKKNRASLPELRHVIVIDPRDAGRDVMILQEIEARASGIPAELIEARSRAVRIDDLATIMYTSGTTGMPKGIQFSQRNLVYKRFARALALPEIGETDVFLSYLPLFHTFGRYLELLGCVFWGAKYCFLTDPSLDALSEGMRHYRPTVFISVPRKWIQLYEAIAKLADPLSASDDELREATLHITGGRLRWGLSAAGYLDPDIFRFFHRQGIQLLSGFGMSEATGGITMTPPFQYKDNSLGVALPGIELKLADDGELLIRGPYVMMGYLDPPDGQASFDEEGWLHTGDLMRQDDEGHIRLVDRKKEIYKNVKGQTIAPQRIENLFREFESVGRSFLVGDHKPYNTLLVYPNPDYEELDFSSLSAQETRDHFRSLVVSVNKFVAPFERVVDFAIIDRDLDPDRDELTPKGTPRRQVVVDNFADVIATLYRRADILVGGVKLTLPNWLFQTLGLTIQDVRVDGDQLAFTSLGTALTVKRKDENIVRVGACLYTFEGRALNLGALLATPRLWLGNDELVALAPLELDDRHRPGRSAEAVTWIGHASPTQPKAADREALEESIGHAEWSLLELHQAGWMLAAADDRSALNAVRLLERALASAEEGPLAEPIRSLLARGAAITSAEARRRAFQVLVPYEKTVRFRETVGRFLARDAELLDSETRAVLCERSLADSKTDDLIDLAWSACSQPIEDEDDERKALSLIDLLTDYAGTHPTRYRLIRAFLVRTNLFGGSEKIREHAEQARGRLRDAFLNWLGPTARIAVDTETGQEYRWEDVVVFGEDMDGEDKRRLTSAIKNTPFLSESIFLLYGGKIVRLADIPPGGVWVRRLGERHGKAVYRVTIQTRGQDTYELAANLNESLDQEYVRAEIDWLILCGDSDQRPPVVEDFGEYVADQDLWSEEYIPGATLDRELRRLARRAEEGREDLTLLWPFLAWSALSAYVDFWVRTGKRFEIADPSPNDIVLPTHDYQSGSRMVSLATPRQHRGMLSMLQSFKDHFVEPVEAEYRDLQGRVT